MVAPGFSRTNTNEAFSADNANLEVGRAGTSSELGAAPAILAHAQATVERDPLLEQMMAEEREREEAELKALAEGRELEHHARGGAGGLKGAGGAKGAREARKLDKLRDRKVDGAGRTGIAGGKDDSRSRDKTSSKSNRKKDGYITIQEIAEIEKPAPSEASEPERVGITFGVEALKDLAAQQAKRNEAQRREQKYTKIDE